MKGDRAASEAVAGPRCHHDMIAAWCSWCLGHDETLALGVAREQLHGIDLVAEINRDTTRYGRALDEIDRSAAAQRGVYAA